MALSPAEEDVANGLHQMLAGDDVEAGVPDVQDRHGGEFPHRGAVSRRGRNSNPAPFFSGEAAATAMLATSRLTSHSNGPGSVSSKSFRSKTSRRSGEAKAPKFDRWASPHNCTRSPEDLVPARSAAIGSAAPRKYANGEVSIRPWRTGTSSGTRDSACPSSSPTWGWLDDDIRLWLRYPSPATRRKQLAELGKPLAGLLAAADGTALAGEIVVVLREHGDDVLACLLPMLRAAGPGPSAPLEELARACERRLTAITERPARADNDWSVPWSGGCGCEQRGTLGGFLADRGERTLEWPLAEARRKHVKDQISAAELPVRHEVWKFGSPHTLVLTKTPS